MLKQFDGGAFRRFYEGALVPVADFVRDEMDFRVRRDLDGKVAKCKSTEQLLDIMGRVKRGVVKNGAVSLAATAGTALAAVGLNDYAQGMDADSIQYAANVGGQWAFGVSSAAASVVAGYNAVKYFSVERIDVGYRHAAMNERAEEIVGEGKPAAEPDLMV